MKDIRKTRSVSECVREVELGGQSELERRAHSASVQKSISDVFVGEKGERSRWV